MSLLHGKSSRRILPRWRASKSASQNMDFTAAKPIAPQPTRFDDPVPQLAHDFEVDPTIGTAADLLSNAILTSNTDAAEKAIRFIQQNEAHAPKSLLALARTASGNDPSLFGANPSDAEQVRQTRRLLRLNPRNPMLWSDFSRHFASVGNRDRAKRCMQVAMALAPNHRWMLRTASRFMAHQGERVEAHKLLANHPRTRHDPWLLAAEIACAQAAGRSPKYWGLANDIIRSGVYAPQHTSELATAIAMMQLEAGDKKKARKIVEKGLIAPTENTLAQVLWAKEHRHLPDGAELAHMVQGRSDAYEADYHLAVAQGNLLDALSSAYSWGHDEPFAARPRIEIAYLASLLDDHARTIEMARAVRRLDGESDPTLEMNSIFATLSAGRLNPEVHMVEIESIYLRLFRAIEQKKDTAYHAMANLGLWYYRYGDKSIGRDLYGKAIEVAEKLNLESAAMAATFAAREAILAKEMDSSAMLQRAEDLSKRSKNKASAFYIRKLQALRIAPEKAESILSPQSAMQFLKVERPAPAFRVEKAKTGNGLILIVPKKLK